jgi:NAD(P)-dependent dehydrogenase (short-subunit alcohol dehydrogenase family)
MSDRPPTPQLVVVTGAAGPLGRAVVAELLARGSAVAAMGRAGDALDEVAAQAGVQPVAADLTDRSAVSAAWKEIDRLGVPTGLVTLAGGFRPTKLADLTPDVLDSMWGSNLASVLWSCQEAAPRMAAAGGGAIVTVGSKTAVTGRAPIAHAVSKAAVVRATELLAEELGPERIRVNCVLPSVIDTPANRAWMSADLAARAVPPRAIATVIAFLLSSDAGPISGARIPVYGDA